MMKNKWAWVIGTGIVVLVVIASIAIREFVPSKKVLPEVAEGLVTSVELFEYPYGEIPQAVKRTVITKGSLVSEITGFFDGTPVTPYRGSPDLLTGKTATAFRMHLADGSVIEATHIFVGNYNTVLFWPDGAVYSTKWGRPYDGYYDDLGVTEQVPGHLVPVVEF